MKIKCLLFLLYNIVSVCVYAQQVEGRIFDEQSKIVAYATILLCNAKDTSFIQGFISDEKGAFSFYPPGRDNYIVKVSHIGYKDAYWKYKEDTICVINLLIDSHMLGDVEIKGALPVFRMKGSALVTDVQNSLLNNAGTANDVLKRIPGILNSGEGFVIFGKGAPMIYINNQLIQNNSELTQLSSKEIAEIELIMNPGAEYDASVKSVIKIKTIKSKGDGFGGYVNMYASQGHRYSGREQINLNYRYKGLDLFSSVAYLHQQKEQRQHSLLRMYLDSASQSDESWSLLNKGKRLDSQIGGNYNFSKNHSLGVRYDFSTTPNRHFSELLAGYMIDNDLLENLSTIGSQKVEATRHKVNAYYSALFSDKWTIELNTDYVSGNNERNQSFRETSNIENTRLINSINRTKDQLYAYKMTAGYQDDILGVKIGNEFSFVNRTNTFVNVEDILKETDNLIKDRKIAAFVSSNLSFGQFDMNLGLRYENVSYDYYDKNIFVQEQSREYNHVYPFFSISYDNKPFQFSLSYAEKAKRPYYYQLRSDIQYNNRFSYETGNSRLQPQLDRSLDLLVGYTDLLFSVSYTHSKNFIAGSLVPYSGNNQIALFSTKNYPKFASLGFMTSYSPQWDIWKPSFSIYLDKPYFTMSRNNGRESFNKMGASFYWENLIQLPYGIIISLDMDYATASNWNVYYIKQIGGVDFGVRKSFIKKTLDLNLQFFDVFATRRSSTVLYGQSSEYARWNYSDLSQVRLTLTYSFNTTRSKYKGASAAQDEINRL